jgi:hypothetical protein
VKSRDNEQLAGTYKNSDKLADCDPIMKVSDLWPNQRKNVNGNVMSDSEPAIPCGLVAKSFFNDTFEFWQKGKDGNPDTEIDIINDNIAWTSDITYKFKNVVPPAGKGASWMDVQWHDMTDRKYFDNNSNYVF